jgi:hypothetical protein
MLSKRSQLVSTLLINDTSFGYCIEDGIRIDLFRILILIFSTFYMYVAISQYHLHMVYTCTCISLHWFNVQGTALRIWVGVDNWQTNWCYRDFYSLVWCQHVTKLHVYDHPWPLWQVLWSLQLYDLQLQTFVVLTFFFAHWLKMTADNPAFTISKPDSGRVWPVSRGCLLLAGSWSYLLCICGSMFAHVFLWLVIPTCISRLITVWYLSISKTNVYMQLYITLAVIWMLICSQFACNVIQESKTYTI